MSEPAPDSRPEDSPAILDPQRIAPAAIVTTAAGLEREAAGWLRRPALGIDTEFFRERTFYPALGLIQVSDGERNVLVDPLALADLEPLREVLAAPGVVKVFHSCGEDLEVLFHTFEEFPRPIFDTQIAAAFAGFGTSPGYGRLVAELFDVHLPKAETRSKWLKRPLSPEQEHYAALDVAYLLPAYRRLRDELQRLGREDWAGEEIEGLIDSRRFLPDPDTVYLGLGSSPAMSRRELAVLRSVCAWRERQARRRDLPRNFVLPAAALPELARRRPRKPRELARVRALRRADVERHGRTLLELVRQAMRLPDDELPAKIRRPLDLGPHRRRLDRLRQAISERARELGLPPELLATRKVAEKLIRGLVRGRIPPLPAALGRWRREALGDLVAASD